MAFDFPVGRLFVSVQTFGATFDKNGLCFMLASFSQTHPVTLVELHQDDAFDSNSVTQCKN
jgi:hypothetical protein